MVERARFNALRKELSKQKAELGIDEAAFQRLACGQYWIATGIRNFGGHRNKSAFNLETYYRKRNKRVPQSAGDGLRRLSCQPLKLLALTNFHLG
jgi:hypothetical protein